MARSHEMDVQEQMVGAAADLEALTSEYESCTRQVERLEAALDALLDDPGLEICLVRDDMRVHAVSRGLAARRAAGRSLIGRRVDEIADETWGDLDALLASLSHDGWEERDVGGGTLRVRRTDAGHDGGVEYVIRFVER